MSCFKWIFFFIPMAFLGCRPSSSPIIPDQSGCNAPFDPNRDYFPVQTRPEEATGFAVSYHRYYKLVNVIRAWPGTAKTFTYVLKVCGAPAPKVVSDAVITIPVQKLVTTSTTQLPGLQQLGVLEKWVGHAGKSFITLPALAAKAKSIAEVGSQELDAEKILGLKPDMVMGYAMGAPTDLHHKLRPLPISVVLNGEFAEASPLARTEWIKFMALFFNKEAEANQIFDGLKQRYRTLQKMPTPGPKPVVFTGSYFNGNWYIAGSSSFMAHLIRDAGATYAIKDTAATLTLDFEGVLGRTKTATHWIGTVPFENEASIRQTDGRFSMLPSAQKGAYFSYDGRFFEAAVLEPDVILRDLRAIFYPDQAKDYRIQYFKGLQ
ncbi:MAG: ABC transporter substrate-binding protein [Bacteroidetes Order II. Incertae sedis bacterium]|nr:ABC transporter substrate-binding protein [Bacteroidetes Order II. bacterium]